MRCRPGFAGRLRRRSDHAWQGTGFFQVGNFAPTVKSLVSDGGAAVRAGTPITATATSSGGPGRSNTASGATASRPASGRWFRTTAGIAPSSGCRARATRATTCSRYGSVVRVRPATTRPISSRIRSRSFRNSPARRPPVVIGGLLLSIQSTGAQSRLPGRRAP